MPLLLTYIRTQFLEINLKVSSLVPRSARSSNISAVVEGIREAYIKRATKHCDKQNLSHYHPNSDNFIPTSLNISKETYHKQKELTKACWGYGSNPYNQGTPVLGILVEGSIANWSKMLQNYRGQWGRLKMPTWKDLGRYWSFVSVKL